MARIPKTVTASAEVPETSPEGTNVAASPELLLPKTGGTVLVANHHTGGIVFPRKGPEGIFMKPLRLAPCTTTQIDAAEWAKYKSNRLVQNYLDAGLLSEVRRAHPILTTIETSSDLQIPENLQTDEEAAAGQFGTAKVTKSTVGAITLD